MFTPYYILAVGFGAFAVIVSVIGMKRPDDFPGKFMGLVVLGGVVLGVATFAFVWKGGEEEVDHRKHEAEKAHKATTGSTKTTLPAGVKPAS